MEWGYNCKQSFVIFWIGVFMRLNFTFIYKVGRLIMEGELLGWRASSGFTIFICCVLFIWVRGKACILHYNTRAMICIYLILCWEIQNRGDCFFYLLLYFAVLFIKSTFLCNMYSLTHYIFLFTPFILIFRAVIARGMATEKQSKHSSYLLLILSYLTIQLCTSPIIHNISPTSSSLVSSNY